MEEEDEEEARLEFVWGPPFFSSFLFPFSKLRQPVRWLIRLSVRVLSKMERRVHIWVAWWNRDLD